MYEHKKFDQNEDDDDDATAATTATAGATMRMITIMLRCAWWCDGGDDGDDDADDDDDVDDDYNCTESASVSDLHVLSYHWTVGHLSRWLYHYIGVSLAVRLDLDFWIEYW